MSLRVLMVGQNPTSVGGGGSDVVFLQEVALLQEAGHEVLPFCALNPAGGELQERYGAGFPHGAEFKNPSLNDYVRYLYNSEARHKIAEAIERFRPDICHLHIFYGKITASILPELRRAQVPCVQTHHDYRYVCPISVPFINGVTCTRCSAGHYTPVLAHRCNRSSLARSALSMTEMYVSDRLGAKRIDHHICVSERQRQLLIRKGLPADRSSVVYNGIDTADDVPGADRDIDILYVGRIETYKGVDTLIDLAVRFPEYRIKAIGEGSYLEAARGRAGRLANLEFVGAVPKALVAEAMMRAKCLLVRSRCDETFGLSSAEAMSCGTPVVASDIGGIPEVVIDGKTGFLVPSQDLEGFADRISRLLGDPVLWRAFATAGRQRVRSLFSSHAHLTALVGTYDTILARAAALPGRAAERR